MHSPTFLTVPFSIAVSRLWFVSVIFMMMSLIVSGCRPVMDTLKGISTIFSVALPLMYESEPSQSEIDQILADFTFELVDGDCTAESWSAYDEWRDSSTFVSWSIAF